MFFESFFQDLRIGLRMLVKDKTFFILAVTVLALGICGVTTQLTMVNAIMLRGFSFPHPEQLMNVGLIDPQASDQNNNFGNGNIPSAQDYEDLRAGQKSFALMSAYLNGFHMYADDMGRQVEAAHFCIHLRHDLHQCVIFDRNAPDGRLIGIEYIVTEERFQSLPDDEKRLWHSHHYEVKSGILVAPGIPELAERSYFTDLVTTYGKTFHTWQYDRDDFPYGVPQLMMGFTGDGQADEALVGDRDRRLGISTARKRQNRADIPDPDVLPGANSWQSGRTVQTRLEELDFRH